MKHDIFLFSGYDEDDEYYKVVITKPLIKEILFNEIEISWENDDDCYEETFFYVKQESEYKIVHNKNNKNEYQVELIPDYDKINKEILRNKQIVQNKQINQKRSNNCNII